MSHIKKFNSFNKINENNKKLDLLKSATNLDELIESVKRARINKGELIKLAYNDNTRNVDSATPAHLWKKLEAHGGTFWFVMDYKPENSYGKLVHLGEKLLGGELTDWESLLTEEE